MQGHVDAKLPQQWSETQNVRWKTPIPGEGWSSPVVWDKQVWMTTAISEQSPRLQAICIDADSGRILRTIEVFSVAEPEQIHALNSYASPSPAIEAGRVYVHFGTYGTAAIDTATGKVLWKRDDLNIRHSVGPGSSPVLFENLLILTMDGTDFQYLVALDKRTGRTVWKTDRSADVAERSAEQKKSFTTPIIVNVNGQAQLISTGPHALYAYEPLTGKEIWRAGYVFGYSGVPRPVVGEGMVYISTGFDQADMVAFRLGDPPARGDISQSHLAWRIKRGQITRRPSFLLIDGTIYMVSDLGIAQAIEAATGNVLWKERMGGEYCASPIYANGLIYFFDQEGTATVIKASPSSLQIVAKNELDDGCMASPAVTQNALIVRTKTHLYRIEQ